MKKILKFILDFSDKNHLQSIGLLILRIGASLSLMTHGYGKLIRFEERSATFMSHLSLGSEVSLSLVIFAFTVCQRLLKAAKAPNPLAWRPMPLRPTGGPNPAGCGAEVDRVAPHASPNMLREVRVEQLDLRTLSATDAPHAPRASATLPPVSTMSNL